ncbi:hypothetical protein HN011_001909 [Eciton burchellii]|nr:hypothetical protein HN011_001909 [Eciton burchellii]
MIRDTDARSARERNCVDRSMSVKRKNLHETTSPSSPLKSNRSQSIDDATNATETSTTFSLRDDTRFLQKTYRFLL